MPPWSPHVTRNANGVTVPPEIQIEVHARVRSLETFRLSDVETASVEALHAAGKPRSAGIPLATCLIKEWRKDGLLVKIPVRDKTRYEWA